MTNGVAQALLTALATRFDAGTAAVIKIYTGTIPTDADTAIAAQTLLATLTMSATAFGAAADANPNATITAAAITSDSSADATGTAAWARISDQAGGTTVMDLDVATSSASITVNTTAFTTGSVISMSSMVITQPES